MREGGSPIDAESTADRVVQVVADHTDTDPLDLPPLYDAVDPDSLNAFVAQLHSGTVDFGYAGYDVSVDSDGVVTLTESIETDVSSRERAADD